MHIDKDLVAAAATPLVLGILVGGESYGYAIGKRVRELSGGQMQWSDGMLYPLLHRLERLGYLTSTWQASAGGRRRKQYAVTEAGQGVLAEHRRQWTVVAETLDWVWRQGSPAAAGAEA